jgi:hypothetical protein
MTRVAWRVHAFRLGLAILAASSAAAAPDWLQECLVPGPQAWRPESASMQLLDSTQVTYVTLQQVVEVQRSARRVTREEGLNHLTFATVYNSDTDRIVSAEAWVVSPDGKRIRSFSRDAFLDSVLQYNHYFWDAERVLQFDGAGYVQMGGTVAWEVTIERNLGIQNVSSQFLYTMMTLRSIFEVIPAPGTKLEWFADSPRLRAPGAGSAGGSLRWELDRLTRMPIDVPLGFLPDRLRVSVRCVAADPSGTQVRTWGDFSQVAARIMDPRLDPGGAVKAQADLLAAGKTTRWDRIRALTEFVQRDIVYLAITLDKDSVAGYRPHPAAEVLRNRYGDCKDKATLLVSMLRAIGEDGRVVLLMAGDPSYVRRDWPSAQFNHAIAAIPADAETPSGWPVVDAGRLGRIVIFDPTDPITPLGVLSSGDQGGLGLVVDPAQGALVRLPASKPEGSGMTRKIEAALDPQGRLSVKVDEQHSGDDGAAWRQKRWISPKDQFQTLLEKRVHRANPLASNLQWSDDWNAASAKYRLNFGFTVPNYGRPLGSNLVVFAPDILPSGFKLLHWEGRRDGVCWLGTDAVEEVVRVTLPPGCTVEELPDPWSEDGKTVSCRLSYRTEGNVIVFQHSFQRRAGFYDEGDYHGLEAFYQRLSEAERRPIILRRRSSP